MSKKMIFRKLPSKCAIDWFQPEKFNSLPSQIRKDYVDAFVVLPLLDQCNKLQVADWSLLPEIEFMEKYGNEIRKLYQFLTQEELDAMQIDSLSKDEDDGDGDGNGDGDGDGDGDGVGNGDGDGEGNMEE
ncbi:hypothetical protein FB446DRAFT_792854 [Lentinula raphanica]|nr:hypothetical protein FB446DRAFT_792854 [Lentinula raphanica]